MAGAEEARGEGVASTLDISDQMLGRDGAQIVRQKIEAEREHIGGLSIALDAAVRRDVLLDERVFNASEKLIVFGGVGSFAERAGGSGHETGIVGEKGGRENVFWRVGLDAEPVPEIVVAPI